jgi:hypothetical protein
MESLTFGVEIEILARPRVELLEVREELEEANWDFTKALDRKVRRINAKILEEFIAKKLRSYNIPAHLVRRDYSKWIVGRDGSIAEPKEEDGSKKYCNIHILKPLIH